MEQPSHDMNNHNHTIQRKAAIAWGKCIDHQGLVTVSPIPNFNLDKTIFTTLEGTLPRMVIEAKIAKSVSWNNARAEEIEEAYTEVRSRNNIPDVRTDLVDFMMKECDFNMEHADGSFLDHLLFCHDYSALYFPEQSPTIQLLHSILGTATNTFAMKAQKIPALYALLSEEEKTHVEAFPSILRLITSLTLLEELSENMQRLHELESIRFHRVIDNEPCTMSADDLWNHLNHHLIHFVDFLPAANWAHHSSDPVLQSFARLSIFLDKAQKRRAKVDITFPEPKGPLSKPTNETLSFGSKVSSFIPSSIKKKLAAKSVRKFSDKIDHSLDYTLTWK